MSSEWDDPAICDNIDYKADEDSKMNYYRCMTNIAIRTKNPQICNQIKVNDPVNDEEFKGYNKEGCLQDFEERNLYKDKT